MNLALKNGGVTLVDDDVLDRRVTYFMRSGESYDFVIGQKRWYLKKYGRLQYVIARIKDNLLLLHRAITQAGPDLCVDHISGDTLDNRTANLRLCTMAENSRNVPSSHGSSGFRGVVRVKNRWVARLQHFDGFDLYLVQSRRLATAEQAAREYDRLARIYHGDFAGLNFPRQ